MTTAAPIPTTRAQQRDILARQLGKLTDAQRLEMLAECLGRIQKWHEGLNRDAALLESGRLPIGDPKDFDALGGCRHEAAHDLALLLTRDEKIGAFLRSEGMVLEKLREAMRHLAERNYCEASTLDIRPEILDGQNYVRMVLKVLDAAPAAGQPAAETPPPPPRGKRQRLDWPTLQKKGHDLLRRAQRQRELLSAEVVADRLGLRSKAQVVRLTEWAPYLAWKAQYTTRKLRISRNSGILAILNDPDRDDANEE
ncbi:MAG: hypothetical protein NTW87_07895 [Planctomycetota bacterium]|nr:hypothetical protein [Planctomycetota bacterium]